MGQESNEFMKSYNMLLMNGIIGILGAIVISYASFQRWEWTFVHAVPELVEKGDWGLVINTISLLYLVISILEMIASTLVKDDTKGTKPTIEATKRIL